MMHHYQLSNDQLQLTRNPQCWYCIANFSQFSQNGGKIINTHRFQNNIYKD
ncbi:hypothetical protein OIU79_007127 [Salix purpurea]|uniref:Uncharacterized protein n=1 Tax=Salix purpurea TaxID=77065 RepID=A0A9Q0TX75_SALPP|nr:hypothetical protein OIU79_007127 [Salix purpurea]